MSKNKMWTIFLSVILISVLAIAGCSNNEANTPSNNKNVAPNDEKKDTSEVVEPEERGDITVSVYDRGSVPPEEGTIDKNRWTDFLIENGPADVEFVVIPRWESREKYNVLFASGGAPDLVFEFDTTYRNSLITQKQLMPINDLIEEHSVEYKALLEQYPILRKLATRADGNMYEFGRLNGLGTNHLLWVREDWLENVGLPVPTTTEELYAVLDAFVNDDPDKNNKKDTLGMGVSFVGGNLLNQMFQDVNYKIQGDTIVRTWENSFAKSTFIKKLYTDKLIDQDFLTDNGGEKAKQDFITGKLGVYGVNGGDAFNIFEGLKTNVPTAKVIAIPLPASEFGQFGPVINNPAQGTAVINANAKDPVAVMKYVDFLVRESTMMTLNYGIEGEHYKINDKGCAVPIDVDKNKIEQNWNSDMRMLVSPALFGDCRHKKNEYDANNPLHKEFIDLIEQADAAYLNPATPLAELTHGEHMPVLPDDLKLIITNSQEQMTAFYQQALLGGSKYTVEQAEKDAKAFWEKAGGPKVDAWYAEWYKTSGQDAILAKDLYELKF